MRLKGAREHAGRTPAGALRRQMHRGRDTVHRENDVVARLRFVSSLYAAAGKTVRVGERTHFRGVGDWTEVYDIKARTLSRVKGTVRRRTPVASNTAFASAAGTALAAASPAPSGG